MKALGIDGKRVSVLRSEKSVKQLLSEFGELWKPLSPAALERLLDGATFP